MAAVSVAGSTFTVEIDATPYSDQVTTGTITTTPVITRTKTLGDNNFIQTDLNSTAELEFLYDEDSGMYDALATAASGGTSVALEVTGGAGTWTGAAVYVEELSMEVAADGVATCAVSFTGTITFA